MLDVRRLQALASVAEHGSFSEAAGALHLTQSAISQQIAALEKETGHQLLIRSRGGVVPTPAGQILIERTADIVSSLREAEDELAAMSELRSGRLRMAAFPSVGATLMPMAITRFRDQYPGVELSLIEAEPASSLPPLRAGQIDLALAFNYPGVPSDSGEGLERHHLFTEPLFLAIPAEHPLSAHEALDLRELGGETWLAGARDGICNAMVHRACNEAGFQPQVSFESDDDSVLLGLVAAGVGITLMPRLCVRRAPKGVVVRPLDPPVPPRSVWAATRAARRPFPAAVAMIELLDELTEELVHPLDQVPQAS